MKQDHFTRYIPIMCYVKTQFLWNFSMIMAWNMNPDIHISNYHEPNIFKSNFLGNLILVHMAPDIKLEWQIFSFQMAIVKYNLVDTEQPNKGKFYNSLLKKKAHTFSNLYNIQRKAAVVKLNAWKQTGTLCNGCVWSQQKGWSEWNIEAWTDASTNSISRNWRYFSQWTKITPGWCNDVWYTMST